MLFYFEKFVMYSFIEINFFFFGEGDEVVFACVISWRVNYYEVLFNESKPGRDSLLYTEFNLPKSPVVSYF